MARRRNLTAAELPRAAREMAAFAAARRRLGRGIAGDGRPVLFLPGFMGADGSTLAIRRLLKTLGYHVHAWRLGRNLGPTDRIIDGLRERVAGLLDQHGQKLTLIGHSLGGVYSREIAKAVPDGVRQVITLGSPMRRPEGMRTAVAPVFQALTPLHSERAKQAPERIMQPVPVPLTVIFTKSDGVVPWRLCIPDAGSNVECIVVRGSHSGLIHNPAAIAVILDRLSQDTWAPFVEAEGIAARVWTADES